MMLTGGLPAVIDTDGYPPHVSRTESEPIKLISIRQIRG
jgi:hypothetical protein